MAGSHLARHLARTHAALSALPSVAKTRVALRGRYLFRNRPFKMWPLEEVRDAPLPRRRARRHAEPAPSAVTRRRSSSPT